MAGYSAAPTTNDNQTPLSSVQVPGRTIPVALQGSTNTALEANNNETTPANFNLKQINDILVQMSGTDGITAANVLLVAHALYNGATMDQQRGNLDTGALIATVTGFTTTQTSADQTNYNGRGVLVTLDMTAVGTGSVTLLVQGKDSASGKYFTLLSGLAVTTNVTNVYTIYPGITASANVSASGVLPRIWRVQVVANNANSAVYTVGATVIV